MSSASDTQLWIKRAEEDLAVGYLTLDQEDPFLVAACYHAHQCVEKYLKAVLISRNLPFPKTHDLLALLTLCQQADSFFGIVPDDLAALAAYAVEIRYPGIDPTYEEAQDALRIAVAVRDEIRRWLNLS